MASEQWQKGKKTLLFGQIMASEQLPKVQKIAIFDKCEPQSNGRKSRNCHFWTNQGMRAMAESPEDAGMAGWLAGWAGWAGLAGWLAGRQSLE